MFGLALRAAREDRGLSMFALAKQAGVSRNFVLLVETGARAPGPKTAHRLSRALERMPSRNYLRDHVRCPDDEVTAYVTRCHPMGLSGDQVAEVLGLSPRTVDWDLSNAITKILHTVHDVSPEGEAVRLWRARLREAVEHQTERERESPWPRGLDQVDEDEDERPLNWWCGDYDGEE